MMAIFSRRKILTACLASAALLWISSADLLAQDKKPQSYAEFYTTLAQRCDQQAVAQGVPESCDNWIAACLNPMFECLKTRGCGMAAGADAVLFCEKESSDCVPQDLTAQVLKFRETGTKCQILPGNVSQPECGNSVVEVHETCDDGNKVEGDGCAADCGVKFLDGPKKCGDGQLDAGEECDAGANNGKVSAACDLDCKKFTGNGGAVKDIGPNAAAAGGCSLRK